MATKDDGIGKEDVRTSLPVEAITRLDDIQAREGLSKRTVAEYAEALQDGAEFPPVVVFSTGDGTYLMADGFHRAEAYLQAGRSSLPVDIRKGTYRDAVLYAIGANQSHGLRRTNADKRKAVAILLKDQEWSKWSDRGIARQAGVCHTFVANMRKELADAQTSDGKPTTAEPTSKQDGAEPCDGESKRSHGRDDDSMPDLQREGNETFAISPGFLKLAMSRMDKLFPGKGLDFEGARKESEVPKILNIQADCKAGVLTFAHFAVVQARGKRRPEVDCKVILREDGKNLMIWGSGSIGVEARKVAQLAKGATTGVARFTFPQKTTWDPNKLRTGISPEADMIGLSSLAIPASSPEDAVDVLRSDQFRDKVLELARTEGAVSILVLTESLRISTGTKDQMSE